MRIIGGERKGWRFHPPANIPARPTTDFAKEALFNILNNHIYFDEISFLDLFAGTGSISYEMFSRGCRDITMVDLSPVSIRFIEQTCGQLNMPDPRIIREDALQFIRRSPGTYDVIFAGPPYALDEIDDIPDMVFAAALLAPGGWFILETSPRHDFSGHENLTNLKHYGQTHFWMFRHLHQND